MSSQHRIDPTRLNALKTQRDAAFSAASNIGETIRDLVSSRARLSSEIHRITYDASQNIGWIDQSQRQKRIDELNAEFSKIEQQIEQAKVDQVPIDERRQSIGSLYTRCAEYMGVNPRGQ